MNRTIEEDVLVPKKLATQGPDYAALSVDYLEAVKSRFQDHAPEKYEEFLEVLKSIKSQSLVRTAVARVKVLLEDHPDLIVGFNFFLPPGYTIPTEDGECECHTGTGEVTNMQQKHVLAPSREIEIEDTSTEALHEDDYHPEYIFCQEVKKKLGNSYDYREFLKCLYIYSEKIISRDELKGMVVSLVRDDEYLIGFIESKKIFGKQENPSYRLWPKNRPIPLTSHRTELGYQVLNDIFISESTTRDEDFKHTQKNKYEERIYLDVKIIERPKLIEAHLTNRYLWCVTDLLKDNPNIALPTPLEISSSFILRRLKQKENELSAYRLEYAKVMAEIRSRNYKKSLNHPSFEIEKQQTQE
ncbi:hypothetical protein MKW92_016759 [Papaver armeniacum]|nr:hypothetical protein MKW92_016759 [Papaver armeniacum]